LKDDTIISKIEDIKKISQMFVYFNQIHKRIIELTLNHVHRKNDLWGITQTDYYPNQT